MVRPQFTLRTLLVITAFAAVLCGYLHERWTRIPANAPVYMLCLEEIQDRCRVVAIFHSYEEARAEAEKVNGVWRIVHPHHGRFGPIGAFKDGWMAERQGDGRSVLVGTYAEMGPGYLVEEGGKRKPGPLPRMFFDGRIKPAASPETLLALPPDKNCSECHEIDSVDEL